MTVVPLLKESLTVTHLRKMHRQGASRVAMSRVAGSTKDFSYLDRRYGITQPAVIEEVAEPQGMTGAEALGTRQFKIPRPPRFIPPELYFLLNKVADVFQVDGELLVSKRSYSFLMQPRSAFVGIAKQLWPVTEYRVLGHVLNRDYSMMTTYVRNYDQFIGSPDYTLKVERVIAAMGPTTANALIEREIVLS